MNCLQPLAMMDATPSLLSGYIDPFILNTK